MTSHGEIQRFHSVWDALEETPELASQMKQRAASMIALSEYIRQQAWSITQAAHEFGVSEPRIAELLEGKIDLFTHDNLLAMALVAGVDVT